MVDAPTRRTRDAYRGCLLGGAVGDALGAGVEFWDLAKIRRTFGPEGLADYAPAYGRLGAITDDTQLTLFTAEALLRAAHAEQTRGAASIAAAAHRAYLRWLSTQRSHRRDPALADGWLVMVPELHAERSPGATCLAALASGRMGTPSAPINDRKGCGGVMRIAPVGLAARDPFGTGCELAAMTHGHPSGFLAAGYLAQLVADLLGGAGLRDAAERGLVRLGGQREHEETAAAIRVALDLARERDPSAEAVESLGAGWVAEEALSIGLYCALVARDLEHGALLAVNHGGDSDSTGSIAGSLLGLVHGERGIPRRWLDGLELREVIAAVADDLWTHFGAEPAGPCEDHARYPAG